MRVLFCTNLPSPYRVDFFNELGKYCELTVCYERRASSERNSKWIGKEAHCFKEEYLNLKLVGADRSKGSDLRKFVKDNTFDIIIFTNYVSESCIEAILFCKIKGIPYCIEYDGGFNKKDRLPKKLFKQFLLKKAKAHFTTCDRHIVYLEYLGIERKKIHKYPFTSLTKENLHEALKKRREKITYRRTLGMKEDQIVISVGRFSYNKGYGKGYDVLMKIAERMSGETGFYIIGDEPTKEFIDWKEEKQLSNVHFIGFKTKDELGIYYAAADAFVLLSRGDIWGLVVNEAMSYKLPVITTEDCMAGTELVKNGYNGYLVDLNNLDNIKEKIDLVVSSEINKAYGNRSAEIISQYTIEKMVEIHMIYFKELIQK